METLSLVPSTEKRALIQSWQTSLLHLPEASEIGISQRLSESCLNVFKAQLSALKNSSSIKRSTYRKLSRALILLNIWIKESGADTGYLDRLLERSDNVKSLVLTSLGDIAKSVSTRLSHFLVAKKLVDDDKNDIAISALSAVIEEISYCTQPRSASESDSDSDASEFDDGDDIEEIANDLVAEASALQDLHLTLQNPLLRQVGTTAAVDLASIACYKPSRPFEDRISARFPLASSHVVTYLGEANLARSLRGQHLRALPRIQDDEKDAKSIIATTFRDSGLGTSVPSVSTPSYAASAVTTMSFYNAAGDCVRFPPLPEEAQSGQAFECACCSQTIRVKHRSDWKRHLLKDLVPYSCFMGDCTKRKLSFTSRGEWTEHLAVDHALNPDWPTFICSLCNVSIGPGRMIITKHLADHLEEISLAALPPSMYDMDEANSESSTSVHGLRIEFSSESGLSSQARANEVQSNLYSPPQEIMEHSNDIIEKGTGVRSHPFYCASPDEHGEYHCPFVESDSCQHKPTRLKSNYDKYLDTHMRPYRCCRDVAFSSTASLLVHQREAHGMHGHGDRPHLCQWTDCERGKVGNGFPRRWNMLDHMRRVHGYTGTTTPVLGDGILLSYMDPNYSTANVIERANEIALRSAPYSEDSESGAYSGSKTESQAEEGTEAVDRLPTEPQVRLPEAYDITKRPPKPDIPLAEVFNDDFNQLQNGAMRNPSRAFQNHQYNVNPLMPSNRSRPSEDSVAQPPRQPPNQNSRSPHLPNADLIAGQAASTQNQPDLSGIFQASGSEIHRSLNMTSARRTPDIAFNDKVIDGNVDARAGNDKTDIVKSKASDANVPAPLTAAVSQDEDQKDVPAMSYTRTGRISKARKNVRDAHICACGKSYTRAEHLRRHKQNHEKLLYCPRPNCEEVFHREDLLRRHERSHSLEEARHRVHPVRCICGYNDDDGDPVRCQVCKNWQHVECYYPFSIVPGVHECYDCRPRPMDREGAASRQKQRREQQSNIHTQNSLVEEDTEYPNWVPITTQAGDEGTQPLSTSSDVQHPEILLRRLQESRRLHGESQLGQRSLDQQSNAYDQQLLAKIGGPNSAVTGTLREESDAQQGQDRDWIDPAVAISQQEEPKVRFYPGMHQQQAQAQATMAAMAAARQEAEQRRQPDIPQMQQETPSQTQPKLPRLEPAKRFICKEPACRRRGREFATRNDFHRHQLAVHKVRPSSLQDPNEDLNQDEEREIKHPYKTVWPEPYYTYTQTPYMPPDTVFTSNVAEASAPTIHGDLMSPGSARVAGMSSVAPAGVAEFSSLIGEELFPVAEKTFYRVVNQARADTIDLPAIDAAVYNMDSPIFQSSDFQEPTIAPVASQAELPSSITDLPAQLWTATAGVGSGLNAGESGLRTEAEAIVDLEDEGGNEKINASPRKIERAQPVPDSERKQEEEEEGRSGAAKQGAVEEYEAFLNERFSMEARR